MRGVAALVLNSKNKSKDSDFLSDPLDDVSLIYALRALHDSFVLLFASAYTDPTLAGFTALPIRRLYL